MPFPSPGDLPDPGIKPGSTALEADALTSEPPGKSKLIYVVRIMVTLYMGGETKSEPKGFGGFWKYSIFLFILKYSIS